MVPLLWPNCANQCLLSRKERLAAEALLGHRGQQDHQPSSSSGHALSSSKVFSAFSSKSDKPGIGSGKEQQVQEAVSVYVSQLPLDITEEEIGILFSPQGKVKKIKLYLDKAGRQKGDALVTFSRPEAATLACLKLNKLDIGDGCVLSVTKAEFSLKPAAPVSGDWMDDAFALAQLEASGLDTNAPMVLVRNVYEEPAVDTTDMETELLLACCGFGDVRGMSFITIAREGKQQGCAAIVFDSADAAVDCSVALQGKVLDGRLLATKLLLPAAASNNEPPSDAPIIDETNNLAVEQFLAQFSAEGMEEEQAAEPVPVPVSAGIIASAAVVEGVGTTEDIITAEIAADLEEVDAFLNSFL